MMISDAILGRSNPWTELFDPGRKALTRGLWDYVKENVDYPYYLIRDRFAGAEAQSLRAVKRGQGKVIERNGAKVAAYRDPAGHGDAPLRDLHAHGMHRGLEHRRADMGLPVSWVALQADRRRDLRAGRSAAPRRWSESRVRRVTATQRRLRLGRPLWLPGPHESSSAIPRCRAAIRQCGDCRRRNDRRPGGARLCVRGHRHDGAGSRRVGRGSTAASSALLLQEPDLELTELTNATGRATAVASGR